jgi:tetratricopeptide (TPR) repeat protein
LNNTDVYTFGELLTTFRKQHHISQNDLAARMDVHRNTIGKWERGIGLPESKTIVLELAKQLRLNDQETRQLLEASLTAVSSYWNVPYQRNPFFTGRKEILHHLHSVLLTEKTVTITQSHALSGLGGIGKTQMAIEYAYQHAPEYAAVFWIGADTYETLTASFISIAELLNLSEKQEQDQNKVVAAVLRWLNSHLEWLLIYDNVEDIEMVKRFLPNSRSGAILFTTRIHALGTLAHTIEVTQMSQEEGIDFLSHRAKLLHSHASPVILSPTDIDIAKTMVELMDGLPLALDQAASYIEATQCSLSDYQQLFQSAHFRLLDERDAYADHPLSVARTFALAFEQLKKNSPVAAELLTVCAFLAPDAIPETFFIEGAKYLGPTFELLAADPLKFNAAIKALPTYSLIQRNATTRILTIHRLVQVVLRESLEETVQRIWEARVIHAMSQLLPREKTEANYWQICERLIPHALVGVTLSEQWDTNEVLQNTLALLSFICRVATYLSHRARFAEAESLYQRALQIGEATRQNEDALMAEALHGLARLYREQGKYEEAEPLYQRALVIRERVLGSEHVLVSETLNELANIYQRQRRYEEAEPLYLQAVRIREQELGMQHAQLASPLYNLAELYRRQGRYEEAEPLYQRSLSIGKHVFGPEHVEIGHSLNGLAMFYFVQDKDEMAEPLYQQALHIWEQGLGLDHPYVAYPLINLGELYRKQGKYEQAELFYQRGLHIWEQALGVNNINVAQANCELAENFRKQGKYEEAEPLYLRALSIREQALGLEHPDVAESVQGLAQLYTDQGKYEQAELFFRRALTIRQQHLDTQHPDVAETLHHIAYFHQLQQHTTEALSLYQQALMMREQALGLHHPKTDATRTAYTQLLRELGRVEEAAIVEAQVQVSEFSSL